MTMRLLILVLLALLAPSAPADGLPDLGEASRADLSPQMERRIGESIMRDIRLREPSYIDDVEVAAYLNQLGARLSLANPEAGQSFEFFALRDATLNAFALPGGFIGVHSGLILAAQSESELAGVLAHEIAHVTQKHLARLMGKQNQAQVAQWLAMAVAILAARSNSDVSQAAIVAGTAAGVQTMLNYSRDFEREADRLGIQTLERAGFDVRGMASFFERMQKFGRLYENNAPGYLRTHPLTVERISDMENRILQAQYRQVADSLEFRLVRAKLRAGTGDVRDAITDFETQLRERKYLSEASARYGLAVAQMRARGYAAVERELAELHRLKASSPMIDTLATDVRKAQGDLAGALKLYREARGRHPRNKALLYGQIDALLAAGQPREALKVASEELLLTPSDAPLHGLQAKSYAALGKRLQQHRAQAELYVLQGQLVAAVQQLELAQKAGDGDFFEHSQVDARLRELRARQAEEAKQRMPM
ncbi:MAG: M48 family metallopeptidase [Zoogloeaceae bacterium]|nr:M48 family metallopeptidase [Zoogloeaceae bacterium]MCK6385652.1 M48 family metalloprotease [Rhodocyclaceae bacterium]